MRNPHWTTEAQEAHLKDHRGPLDHKEQRIARLIVVGFVLLGVALVAASTIAVLAIERKHDTKTQADRQISALTNQVAGLKREIQAGNRRIGELTNQVAALQEQVRQLGGTPVNVNVEGAAGTTTTSTTSTTTAPPPTTTTTTAPPRRSACVAGVCVSG